MQAGRAVCAAEWFADLRELRRRDFGDRAGETPRMTLTQWRATESDVQKTHPIQNGLWVDVIVELLCVATGERRERLTHTIYKPDEDGDAPSTFYWSEGNASCDCNRALDFLRAGGHTIEDVDPPCGDGAYLVNLRNPVTGEVFYREFGDVPEKPRA